MKNSGKSHLSIWVNLPEVIVRKISNLWVLRPFEVELVAKIIWRMAVILFGLKIIMQGAGAILVLRLRSVPIESANISSITLAFNGALAVATLILQLLVVRFLIEVGLHVLRRQNPERQEGMEVIAEPAASRDLTHLIPPVAASV